MTITTPDIYAAIYAAHGHRCPMSTLGGRLGLAAAARLGEYDQSQLQAVYLSRTCATDGITMTLGCREGGLEIRNDGRHRLEVGLPGYRLALELAPAAMQLAGSYRQLANKLEAGWESLSADEQTRRQAQLDAALDVLLPKLWHADEAELLLIQEEADA